MRRSMPIFPAYRVSCCARSRHSAAPAKPEQVGALIPLQSPPVCRCFSRRLPPLLDYHSHLCRAARACRVDARRMRSIPSDSEKVLHDWKRQPATCPSSSPPRHRIIICEAPFQDIVARDAAETCSRKFLTSIFSFCRCFPSLPFSKSQPPEITQQIFFAQVISKMFARYVDYIFCASVLPRRFPSPRRHIYAFAGFRSKAYDDY